ncbi:hypothetical protein NDU88_004626 [Pleurodeles waltl]|uniref:Uncharacterized protein n=1 Tax=Pleurodeles waltl TaxID=8319 RepID=A0AAV7V4Z4_PLEWA|nr:hypothetical protein NDU88_004626 [Pleurodeles waltl]
MRVRDEHHGREATLEARGGHQVYELGTRRAPGARGEHQGREGAHTTPEACSATDPEPVPTERRVSERTDDERSDGEKSHGEAEALGAASVPAQQTRLSNQEEQPSASGREKPPSSVLATGKGGEPPGATKAQCLLVTV